jgi:hypothetical protein
VETMPNNVVTRDPEILGGVPIYSDFKSTTAHKRRLRAVDRKTAEIGLACAPSLERVLRGVLH